MKKVSEIIEIFKTEEQRTGIKRTLFAACPNSQAVISASIRSAKRNNAPLIFATTLNQVDSDRGYTNMNHQEFSNSVNINSKRINCNVPIVMAIDHGGPWLKDKHRAEKYTFSETMEAVKKSYEEAILAGFTFIHVDPTVDIRQKPDEPVNIDWVVKNTVELIFHCEEFCKNKGIERVEYEVGTEEVHGGLSDEAVFIRFLNGLKSGLAEKGLKDVWPCFVVGKVGTDLHTTTFDPIVAKRLTEMVSPTGSLIKGHYSDNVTNPEQYPISGMGAANIGPEFTESEYDGLLECIEIEEQLIKSGGILGASEMKRILWDAVIDSNRWQKWLSVDETNSEFKELEYDRQTWIIKTCCRYIWENESVKKARQILYNNLLKNNIDAEEIVLSRIEKSIDKYYRAFNLIDSNSLIENY